MLDVFAKASEYLSLLNTHGYCEDMMSFNILAYVGEYPNRGLVNFSQGVFCSVFETSLLFSCNLLH